MASSNANGVSVGYAYDNLNRLATVVDNRLPVGQNTTAYTYDAASNLATVTYPNGLSSTFVYDDLNRLRSVNGYSYTLGATGNRLVLTLLRALKEKGLRHGLASLCIGGGQGMAIWVERIA